ncbi:MAG: Fic family protein [Candidatus Dependentiae bacterium]|nr:Fic family protein [Candidatus Dependentiae bacterium]
MRITGQYQYIGNIRHFIPDPLPPENPPFILNTEIMALYGDAMLHLGKLNEMSTSLPDVQRFIKAYIIKEALLSSAIEGIHTTLLDVYTQPLLEEKPNKNTQLVMNYTTALEVALSSIEKDGPIDLEGILAAHKALMELEDDEKANPGKLRNCSVRVGQLIPPPAHLVPPLMADLQQYINNDKTVPALIQAGLAHVQFETIHPFLDGNGRIGRLLIVLMLIKNGLLAAPILYPSYYFKKYHMEYYHYLDGVRMEGDFEGWIIFYLTAIRDSSIDAYKRAKGIETLREQLIQLITNNNRSPKAPTAKLRALSILFHYPVISTNLLSEKLEVAYNTAHTIIDDFIELGILEEETQQKRGKLFKFKEYLEILDRSYDRKL